MHGLEESEDEDVKSEFASLIPGATPYIRDAKRIGKQLEGKTRPILVQLSPQGKTVVWENKRNLEQDGKPIYINHDLSTEERKKRKEARPHFKKTPPSWCKVLAATRSNPPKRRAHDCRLH